jgi:hypothetical protein
MNTLSLTNTVLIARLWVDVELIGYKNLVKTLETQIYGEFPSVNVYNFFDE